MNIVEPADTEDIVIAVDIHMQAVAEGIDPVVVVDTGDIEEGIAGLVPTAVEGWDELGWEELVFEVVFEEFDALFAFADRLLVPTFQLYG